MRLRAPTKYNLTPYSTFSRSHLGGLLILGASALSRCFLWFLLCTGTLLLPLAADAQTNTPAPVPTGATPTRQATGSPSPTLAVTLPAGSACPPVGSVEWDRVTDEYALYCSRCDPVRATATPRLFPSPVGGGSLPTFVIPTGSAFSTAVSTPLATATGTFTPAPSPTPNQNCPPNCGEEYTLDFAGDQVPFNWSLLSGSVITGAYGNVGLAGDTTVALGGGQVTFIHYAYAFTGQRGLEWRMIVPAWAELMWIEYQTATAGWNNGWGSGWTWHELDVTDPDGTLTYGRGGNINYAQGQGQWLTWTNYSAGLYFPLAGPSQRVTVRLATEHLNGAAGPNWNVFYKLRVQLRGTPPPEQTPTPTATSPFDPALNTPVPLGLRDCSVVQYRNTAPVAGVELGSEVDYQCYRLVPEINDFLGINVTGVDVCVSWLAMPSVRFFDFVIPISEMVAFGVVIYLIRLLRMF